MFKNDMNTEVYRVQVNEKIVFKTVFKIQIKKVTNICFVKI